jgi:YVTN family beta-propeller protein
MKTRPSAITALLMGAALLTLLFVPSGTRFTAAQPLSASGTPLNKAFVTIESPNSVTVLDTTKLDGTSIPIIQSGLSWPKPPHSGVITPDGSHLFLVGYGDGTVYGMKTDTYDRDITIPLAGCDQRGIAISSDGLKLYVADNCLRTITPIDLTTNMASTPISLAAHPEQIALSPDGSHLYVAANFPDTDFAIDTNTRAVAPFAAGANGHGVAVSPDGQSVYIANSNDGTVSVIAAQHLSVVKTIPVAFGVNHLTLTSDGTTLYATNYANNTVSVIGVQNSSVTSIPVPSASRSDATISEDGAKALVALANGSVAAINTSAPNTTPQYISVGGLPYSVVTKSVKGIAHGRPPVADASLLAPFNNGVTWTVYNGYYDNTAQDYLGCGVGSKPLDHCRNQLFSIDLKPDQSDNGQILAPVSGKVAYVEGGCVGLTLDDGLNLNMCHFDGVNVKQGEPVTQGKVLGTRNTSTFFWVHLSLDKRNALPGDPSSGDLCPGTKNPATNKPIHCYLPIPFNGTHIIEGMSLDPNQLGDGDPVDLGLVYSLCKVRKSDCQFKVKLQEWRGTPGRSSNNAKP